MRLVLFLTLSALAGCASYQNAYAPENMRVDTVPRGNGIIIISTGAPSACISTSTFLTIQPASEHEESKSAFTLPVDSSFMKSDFPGHQGNVSVISMPAGNYKITPQVANIMLKGEIIPVATFSVSPNENTYIGEYFIPTSCRFDMRVVINDKRDRDLLIATQNNSNIDSASFTTKLATFVEPQP